MNVNIEDERRGSRSRALERSLSYSEAIGNGSGRSSIEIPRIGDTEVYTNEEIKKQYRISQTYVEGREIAFPYTVTNENLISCPDTKIQAGYTQYSSEDEHTDSGLVMTIDVETESPKSSDKRNISDASTQPLVGSVLSSNTYEIIQTDDSIYNEIDERAPSTHGFSTLTRRKKNTKRSRYVIFGQSSKNNLFIPTPHEIFKSDIFYFNYFFNFIV